ncbi:MAG: FHA domain-containing protein [Methanobacteriota archaeon]
MADRPYRGAIDYEKLGLYLRALSVPTRILLLQKLQLPHTPSEIELPPFRKDPDLRQDRVLSRQAVDEHLQKLEEAGLVRSRPSQRGGQPVREYLVNQERLFTLVDEVRRLALIRAAGAAADDGTPTGKHTIGAASEPPKVTLPHGPSLLLVSGPYEGKAYSLAGPGPWAIGRAKEAEVSIDYDPFVSARNTEVLRDGAGFYLKSLPDSRNGTTVNWRLLRADERVPLSSGDTIGVGRTLLVARGV